MSKQPLRLPVCTTMPDFVVAPVTIRSPATSANLGPGFDSLGLSLAWYDDLQASVTSSGLSIQIAGEGEDTLPRDERHLVVRAMRATFDFLGVPQPGLQVTCRNSIPQGRGLGSSAAAIVAGIRLAEELVEEASLSGTESLALATELEGHPDNVAACLLGGFTIAWTHASNDVLGSRVAQAVSLAVHPDVRPVVFIPPHPLSTEVARGLLPGTVPHRDAATNSGRAALLVAALTQRPDELLAATEDRLHQAFRRPAMSSTLELVEALRAVEVAAVVSGAGPTVLALGTSSEPVDIRAWCPAGWSGRALATDAAGAGPVSTTKQISRAARERTRQAR